MQVYTTLNIAKSQIKWSSYKENQIVIDTQEQVILTHKVTRKPRHDSKDATSYHKLRKYKPASFSLDKVFDHEKYTINDELGSKSIKMINTS